MREARRGSITVFLALFLTVLMALLGAGIRSVQMAAARTQMLCSVDMGLFSLFGQYDRELMEEYGLFLLNAGVGGDLALSELYRSFESYMKGILEQNSQVFTVRKGGLSRYELVTDHDGEAFYRQAVKAQKAEEEAGSVSRSELRSAVLEVKHYENLGKDFEKTLSAALEKREKDPSQEELTAEPIAETEGTAEVWKLQYEALRERSWEQVYGIALERREAVISDARLSTRDRETGMTFWEEAESLGSGSSGELALLRAYLCDHLGNYQSPGRGTLHYGLEYVVEGGNSDRENLEAVLQSLRWIREGTLWEQQGCPQDSESCARIAVEAAGDVKTLLHGGTWESRGYVDYLRLFLESCGKPELVLRGMDVIEQEIRARGRKNFRLDHCLTALEVTVEVEANHEKTFQIVREYEYD